MRIRSCIVTVGVCGVGGASPCSMRSFMARIWAVSRSLHLIFSVSVVVVLLTCENVRLFVEEILDERLLGVREFGGVVLLWIGGFEFCG